MQSTFTRRPTTNIKNIDSLGNDRNKITIVNFSDRKGSLELKIGFSFVSTEKQRKT